MFCCVVLFSPLGSRDSMRALLLYVCVYIALLFQTKPALEKPCPPMCDSDGHKGADRGRKYGNSDGENTRRYSRPLNYSSAGSLSAGAGDSSDRKPDANSSTSNQHQCLQQQFEVSGTPVCRCFFLFFVRFISYWLSGDGACLCFFPRRYSRCRPMC